MKEELAKQVQEKNREKQRELREEAAYNDSQK